MARLWNVASMMGLLLLPVISIVSFNSVRGGGARHDSSIALVCLVGNIVSFIIGIVWHVVGRSIPGRHGNALAKIALVGLAFSVGGATLSFQQSGILERATAMFNLWATGCLALFIGVLLFLLADVCRTLATVQPPEPEPIVVLCEEFVEEDLPPVDPAETLAHLLVRIRDVRRRLPKLQ